MYDLQSWPLFYEAYENEPQPYNLRIPKLFILAVYWFARRLATARRRVAAVKHRKDIKKGCT